MQRKYSQEPIVKISAMHNIRWWVWLTCGMLVGVLPGIFLAPYSVNFVDEPYQILNAYDVDNAVYSPLASALGHFWGNLFGWRYLAFRYLCVILNFLGLYVCAVYALLHSKFKVRIIIVAVVATFLSMFFKTFHNVYGWDNWTVFFTSLSLICCLSLLYRFSWYKLILLAFFCAANVLVRLPNITVLIFVPLILVGWFFPRPDEKNRCIASLFLFLFLAGLFLWLLLTIFYGSFPHYLDALGENQITSHSVYDIVKPLFSKLVIISSFAFIYYLGLRLLKFSTGYKYRFTPLVDVLLVSLFLFTMVLDRGTFFGMGPASCLAVILLGIIALVLRNWKHKRVEMVFIGGVLTLFAIVPAIGSNVGLTKALSWPLFPLLALFLGKGITPLFKRFAIDWSIAYLLLCFVGLTRRSFLDDSILRLDYRFSRNSGVFEGMVTTHSKGILLDSIYADMRRYRQENYSVIPLRECDDYIWEYMLLSPNPYQRHLFGNEDGFLNAQYVDSVKSEIHSIQGPVVVMFMAPPDSVGGSPMMQMLEEKMIPVVKSSSYSFWERK